jgi:CysZ protein
VTGPRTAIRDFFGGAALVGQGLRMWVTAPRLMFLGAIPAIVVGILYAAGIVLVAVNLDGIAGWATPFAAGWTEPFRSLAHIIAALAVLGAAILLVIATYTALTLAVGEPFYEKIWRRVEDKLGGIPGEVEVPLWRSIRLGLVDGLRIVVFAASVGIALFFGGFIPVVGQTVVPMLAAATGGWLIALELTGRAFEARGMTPGERRRVLRRSRATALGFGVSTYLLFLVPLGAVIVMPAAVAGAALLSREVLARSAGGTAPPTVVVTRTGAAQHTPDDRSSP